ncbi:MULTISPECIES: efflux transporter outer membrane subunit [unclassified Pseudoxanthomonas]|uniref:efflux transporter outer membrane subunit n=1 Tax=unclassified Pseudoxanthomonas TaxID=2645906 RepID=UPI0008E3E1BB|nr:MULTISPECIES: efflux transporter outer membrane subunit [unclassified Pseudoxanthomonas]PPJ43182.1 RND transporter [Pseudoxanthomonas sp. KAs_5_3]SFV34405.1 efflux transporter, outer membrane factor (OMF) lipoprotein, NodT family [Pseudoxanthomonas sp. YR558]
MVIRPLVIAVASVVLAGCVTVGPDYVAPQTAPATLQHAGAAEYVADHPVAAWWSQFDDPVLDQLVRESLLANPDVRIAVSRVDEARAVFSERRWDLAPHVTAGVEGTRTKQPVEGQGRVETDSYSAGFDAAWELDLFGRVRRSAEAAHADLQAQRNDLQAAQVTVAAEVARNYFELRGTQKRLDVARRILVSLGETQRLTESRFDLGAGSQLDVQSSLARVKAVEAEVPLLETAEGQSRHRLAVLVGKRPGELDALLAPREAPAFAKALPIGDTTELLRQRPDVRAAERRLAAATARVGVATADLFPRVSLRGFVGFLSGGWGNLFNGDNRAWQVTPSISWAAFDMGSVRARLRASEAQADGVAAQYEKTVLGALEDTENALLSYAKQQAQLKFRLEQSVAARRAAELAEVRYRAGSSDFLTLLDAQRTQLAADDALAQAEAGVNVGVVAIYKSLGGWGEQDVAAALAVQP